MPAAKQSSGKQSQKRAQKHTPEPIELLQTELREIYSAENQLSRFGPKLMKAVESEAVRQLLEQRVDQGRRLIEDIDRVFEELDTTPGRKKNVAAEGLILDMQDHIGEIEKGPALDAVLVGAVQKLEHYCIAAWGTTRAMAEAMEMNTAVQAMQRALDEGKELDQALTQCAEDELLPELIGESEELDEDEPVMETAGAAGKTKSRSGK